MQDARGALTSAVRRCKQLVSFLARTLIRPRGIRAHVFAGALDSTFVHVSTGAFVRLEFVAGWTHAFVAAVVIDTQVFTSSVVSRAFVHICKEFV